MRLKARARLLRMRLTARWRAAWRPEYDLGTVSREKLYEIEGAHRRNVIRDKKGNEWPARLALALGLVCLAASTFATPQYWQTQRKKEFEANVRVAMKKLGLAGEVQVVFVYYHHPAYCAWTSYDEDASKEAGHLFYEVGLSIPDPKCERSESARTLAIHEVCHISLAHLLLVPRMDEAREEAEVQACIVDYNRRKEER